VIQRIRSIIDPAATISLSGAAAEFGKPPDGAVAIPHAQHSTTVFYEWTNELGISDEPVYLVPRP
jgi:hypothetical protein